GATAGQLALEGGKFVEQAVEDGRTAGVAQQFSLVADQRAGGNQQADARAANAGGTHVGEFTLALGQLLNDRAGVLVIDVDDNFLAWLEVDAVFFLEQYLAAASGQLEPFAAHLVDQHGQLQFAATGDVARIIVFTGRDADRDIAFGFAHQALADNAGVHLVAFTAGQWAVIDAEGDRQGRRID